MYLLCLQAPSSESLLKELCHTNVDALLKVVSTTVTRHVAHVWFKELTRPDSFDLKAEKVGSSDSCNI